MAELIAHGSTFENRWRRRLAADGEMMLGRNCDGFTVPWDNQISRQHATLRVDGQRLHVRKIPAAGNPIFFRGAQTQAFAMDHGDHFVIGETTFNFTVNQALATVDVPNPIQQKTFSSQFLKQVRYRDADRRMNVLTRLPDVIASAANEEDLLAKMVNTLLAGISSASTIGVIKYLVEDGQTEVVHWDRRSFSGGDFEASQRLIRQSVEGGETVLHFWDKTAAQKPGGGDRQSQYTFDLSNDWAFACPLDASQDGALPAAADRWVIYVTGRNKLTSDGLGAIKPIPQLPLNSSETDLEGDIKFCELIASMLCRLLQLRKLQQRQASLRPFFSPAVTRAFANEDPDTVLKPRQCLVSVLFCDLRGFSKTSEAFADDLLKLLSIVSQSLGVMTSVILDQGGVIGDFHGDAAMGFWGWPIDQSDGAVRAVTAAIEIQNQIKQMAAESSHEVFKMGIGIGTGEAVAGRIGTDDQVKVTAFGPVVNVASRLEGMTQQLGCSILIDEATALALPPESAFSPMPLGEIQPFAMQRSVKVYHVSEGNGGRSSTELEQVERAVAEFGAGNWDAAKACLQRIADEDPTKQLLLKTMGEWVTPPANFDGLIPMKRK
jgi:adenylate cyclase